MSIHSHSPSRRLQMVVLVGTVFSVAVFTVGTYLTSPVTHAHARVVSKPADSTPAPTVRPGPQPGETLVTVPNCVQWPDQSVVDHAKFTDAQLKLYGLPLPENFPGGRNSSFWIKLVRAAKYRECTLTTYANGPKFVPMSPRKTLNEGSLNQQDYWVGYEQNETNYQFAYAAWTQPSVTYYSWTADDGPFVGMGGFGNNLLIQAGSYDAQDYDPVLGLYKWQGLWFENYGNTNGTPGYDINWKNTAYFGCKNSTNHGDSIVATVANGTGTGEGPAYMYVEDEKSGCVMTETFGPGGNNQQFECIVERTSDHYLNDFSSSRIPYSDCQAWTSNNGGFYVNMGHNPGHWTPFQMIDPAANNTLCADRSTSTGSSGGFTVSWYYRCSDGSALHHP